MNYWELWKMSATAPNKLPQMIYVSGMSQGHDVYVLKDGDYVCRCGEHCLHTELPLHHAKAEIEVLKK